MYFRFLSLLSMACTLMGRDPGVLRVCADPNNLPFSNDHQEGFENRLAEVIARDLGVKLEYTWWSQRRSFIRNSLGEGRCDVLIGVPTALPSVSVTQPYYRSTYVFVTRKDRNLRPTSLDDPRFERWRIGIHMVGEDYAPPAIPLARRGLAANITGFKLYGEYGGKNVPARLIEAVATGNIDVAIVWGPFAGYFAAREAVPLELIPVSPDTFLGIPFTFEISMAVRKGNEQLKSDLEHALDRHCGEVGSILNRYQVPRVVREDDKDVCGASHSWSPF